MILNTERRRGTPPMIERLAAIRAKVSDVADSPALPEGERRKLSDALAGIDEMLRRGQ